jgi:hypothetical protein
MKTKKISKKLVIVKVTVTNLDNNEMKAVYGGQSLKECSLSTRPCSQCCI